MAPAPLGQAPCDVREARIRSSLLGLAGGTLAKRTAKRRRVKGPAPRSGRERKRTPLTRRPIQSHPDHVATRFTAQRHTTAARLLARISRTLRQCVTRKAA
jgi:hypothetical protein